MLMSTFRSRVIFTGRLVIFAATAAALAAKTVRVSLPPKPPPIRLVLTITRCIGRPVADAQQTCVLSNACVEE